jgi:hypothetical protein
MQTLTPSSIEMSCILKLKHTDEWKEYATYWTVDIQLNNSNMKKSVYYTNPVHGINHSIQRICNKQ